MTWPHIILILFLSFLSKANAVCYFPVELQGIFATQSTLSGGGTHKYSQITILPEAIPVWGVCHEMFGESVVLRDDTGGQACFRCFQVATHSPNVIQVFTEGLDKCYLNSGAARASCPSKDDIKNRIAREIMLYKSRSFTRDGQIDRLMCPFSGKFHFTYDVNDGTENTIECPDAKSVITNCPNGSELQLRFSQCRFRDTNMALQCLGHWKGVDGFQYFALWDTRVTSEDQPQYRCAMYHKEADTGRVFIGFSVDATCTNRLHSPWDGYETMVLTPTKKPSPPAPIHSHSCTFPQWSFGKWKTMQIDGRKLIWKDLHRDKYYEALCLAQNKERFAIYTLNQCGQEEYTCIWIKSRDVDVFEYKIASVQYNYFNNTHLCSDDVFVGQKWRTEGRLSDSKNKNCPVLGEYEGIIPDAPELCAKLTSNCRNPALMHYTVFSCGNSSQVYEKREYQCLGRWKEGGIMYTFTYRLDVQTYECFAGVMVSETEGFIIEAGVSCKRGLQPLIKGMKLMKKGSCDDSSTQSTSIDLPSPSHPSLPNWWPSTKRRPNLKKSTTTTNKPRWKNEKPRSRSSCGKRNVNIFVLVFALLAFVLHRR